MTQEVRAVHVSDTTAVIYHYLARHRRAVVASVVAFFVLLVAGAVASALDRPLVVALIASVGIMATAVAVLAGTAYYARKPAGAPSSEPSERQPRPAAAPSAGSSPGSSAGPAPGAGSAAGRGWRATPDMLRPALTGVRPRAR